MGAVLNGRPPLAARRKSLPFGIQTTPASGDTPRRVKSVWLTGVVAKLWGPKVGGLLLALPAILPIGVALIAKLQDRKAGPGARGDRGRRAAMVEATGASAAAIGLIGFAVVAWRLLIRWPSWLALATATTAWVAITLVVWLARKAPRSRAL